jgi:uncharacterized protein YjlB
LTWLMAQPIQPEKAYFEDDGGIPNSALPLLPYRQAFPPGTPAFASAIEEHLAKNGWTGSWRAAVFPFHHYHSTTHEVLAVYRGMATLQLGGEKGRKFAVKPGDVIAIPAGVGHKRVEWAAHSAANPLTALRHYPWPSRRHHAAARRAIQRKATTRGRDLCGTREVRGPSCLE